MRRYPAKSAISSADAITTETAMLMPVLIWKEPNPGTLLVPKGAGGGTVIGVSAPGAATGVLRGMALSHAWGRGVPAGTEHTGLPDRFLQGCT